MIRVEDLNIKNMTRSVRGTAAQPGKNVAAKAGLNREISRSAWGALVGRLEDKAPGRVQKVPPAYTLLPLTASAYTVLPAPLPNADHVVPSHFAMWFALTPPAVVKSPPT